MTDLLHADEIAVLTRIVWPWTGMSRHGFLATQPARHGGRGYAPEFMRQYQLGDDVRLVDWPATVRMQRAMVRQPQPMRQGTLRIAVDTSISMTIPARKWNMTMRTVAAIGVIGLAQHHRVHFSSARHNVWYTHLSSWLADCETYHDTAPTPSFVLPVDTFVAQPAVLCSDLWHDDWQTTLARFAATTDQGVCIQLLDQCERIPDIDGEVTLIDSETRQQRTFTVDESVRARYQAALQTRLDDIRLRCRQLAIHHVLIDTDTDVVRTLAEVTT